MKTLNNTDFPTLQEKGFSILSVQTPNDLDSIKQEVANAYKAVFNASAWREGVKCSAGCGYKTTFEEAPKICPDCGGGIEDYYQDNEVIEAVEKVLSSSYSQCLLLTKNDDVAGFIWGWKDSLGKINQDKLGLTTTQEDTTKTVSNYALLIKNILQNGMNGNSPDWYYLSELGIVPKFREKGMGRLLVDANLEALKKDRDFITGVIQRTSRNSPMFGISNALGYTEVYSYNDDDQRCIFAKNNQ